MTAPRPRITDEQRRDRLATAHLLTPAARAQTPVQVADALVALHATDPATVHLAVAARTNAPTPAALERALYEDRSLLRMLCMRRTMFVVPRELAPVVDGSTARAVAARERGNLLKVLGEQHGYGEDWLAATERAVLEALADAGEATATALAEAVPALRTQLTVAPGKPYGATPRITTRVLGVLAAQGRIRRGRPLGTWASSQFRWALAEPHPDLPVDEARVELLVRRLRSFGPSTVEDLKWWTGWTLTDTRRALARTGAVEVDLSHGPGHALPDQLDPPAAVEPAAALLPSLDPTAMGWRHRDWYLDPALVPELFDTNGNIGPTLWWDGRIVGGWAQRPDGEIVTRPLTPPGRSREARAAIATEAARLADFLGGMRFRPSMRTPFERRLAAGDLEAGPDAP
ncbi:winged helix DNA-binding domain-containing protein [Streptomyces sp. NPDC048606]|uniref:winged helix DNA-binding domain-containing protein n=1 Tax=Streptomyces sp. NPDC048606 TaxID=3154726 RepID=UPI00343A2923